MANMKPKTLRIRGKASYAKILGDPVTNYAKDGKEWKMDLELEGDDVLKELNKEGLKDKIKNKEGYLDGAPYMSFKHAATRLDKKTGQIVENKPIRVFDAKGQPWDTEQLIGNGSVVDVKFEVIDWGSDRIGCYIRAVRVIKLVPYMTADFDPLDEDDEFYVEVVAKGEDTPPFEDDLDDDMDI